MIFQEVRRRGIITSPPALPPGDGTEEDRLKKCLSQEQSALRQGIHGDCLARYIRKFMPIFSI
jgi:hypothetical protein